MSNDTTVACPKPFLNDRPFDAKKGGYIDGRFCGINPGAVGQKCCLPCPVQSWVYDDNYLRSIKAVNWVSISSLVLCGFLLISFVVLPPEKSSRHYLTIGVTLAVTAFTIPFVIPLGTKPSMCFDEITPNGQDSDMSCAWSGALLLLGSLGSAFWVFLRSLWLNLRVCWDKDPGKKYMISSLITGILFPVTFTAASLAKTGVSYRAGLVCLPNHKKSIPTFWVWLIGFAGAALVIQALTTGYCVWVYIRVQLRARRPGAASSASSGHYTGGGLNGSGAAAAAAVSAKNLKPQRTWRKIRRVLLLQWRGIALTTVVTVETLYYIIVFWAQDTKFGEVSAKANSLAEAKTWTACLVLTLGDKNACLKYTNKLTIPKGVVLGSLMLGSLIGAQNFILLARTSMFVGWWHLLRWPYDRLVKHRRGSDLPLTSLMPQHQAAQAPDPDHDHDHPYHPYRPDQPDQPHIFAQHHQHSRYSTTAAAAGGTTPLMSSPAKPSSASASASASASVSAGTSTGTSVFTHSRTDSDGIPTVTLSNPYKLSLPSERASLAGPLERRRLARSGEIVDFDYHGTDAREPFDNDDDDNNDEDARPATPPPPPLPLNLSNWRGGPNVPGASASGSGSGSGTATATSTATATAATATIPPPSRSGTIGSGVANKHRLPSWARDTSEHGAGLGLGLALALADPAAAAAERDAMRGGLALHPVDADAAASDDVGDASASASASAFSSSDSSDVEGRLGGDRRASRGSGGGRGNMTVKEFLKEEEERGRR